MCVYACVLGKKKTKKNQHRSLYILSKPECLQNKCMILLAKTGFLLIVMASSNQIIQLKNIKAKKNKRKLMDNGGKAIAAVQEMNLSR